VISALHCNHLPKAPVSAMSTTDFDTNTSNGNSRKRKRKQESAARKKPRLDEGTSDSLQAKLRSKSLIQKLRESAHHIMGKQPNTYVYPPLEEGNGQDIRVLIIEPGKDDEPIKCKLVPSALPKSKQSKTKAYLYTALSYYWGEGLPIHPITITSYITSTKRMNAPSPGIPMATFRIRKKKEWRRSGEMYVRSNLYVALRRFRRKKKKTIMWIDALCIDQDDKFERSEQVKKMHELYLQAENVKIWLGDGSTATACPKRCFGFLRKILDLQNLDSILDDLQRGGSDVMETAGHVVQLMCNKWFSRRWVIQELALARKAEVVYGKKTMLWSDFADAIAIFIKSQERIGAVLSKMIAEDASSIADLRSVDSMKNLGANALVDFINNLFRRSENGDIQQRMMTLESLVSNLLAFEASNPRDTIYAVLSLAEDTHNFSTETNANAEHMSLESLDERLLPAYQHCLLDVYTDFIEYCIDKSHSLDILLRHWAPSENREMHKTLPETNSAPPFKLVNMEELPTWIPLIQKSSYGTPAQRPQGRSNGDSFVGTAIRSSQRNYSATLNLPPEKRFERISYTPDIHKRPKKYTGSLFVRGLRIGKVEKTTQRAAQGMLFKESFELAGFEHERWQQCQEWAAGTPRIPEGFWRTIVADRGPDGANPPSWYPRACFECLNNMRLNGDLNPHEVIGLEKASSMAKLFLERVKDVVWERSIVRIQLKNKKDTYGLSPKETKEGDIVCVLFGCSVPVVLRKVKQDRGKPKHFKMIGECFVYGMMDGEAVAGKQLAPPYDDAEEFQIK
jgi:hypothetical protein